ncbi:von Willebrand factor type A domain-containing protein [Frigoribacterium sp. PhB160]|uniref:VWA domain-containing protein n=1 Tax=Frigoribacterium sp. PhB160 TaxID=2485192 RepID=UPI000F4A9936|nr:VWA domain-containing protein [Frigoribacterium sp. PhB160]ROS62076.1 von Willebrand factor type A domain-containing protein [Frigoribacterium sp. PhB160]
MGLIFWWVPLVALVVVGVAAWLYLRWRRRERARLRRLGTPVAHSERLTGLPVYRRLVRRYRALLAVALVGVVALSGIGVLLASRVSSTEVVEPQSYKRDVILCLDVSGSMTEVDAQIVDTFAQLAQGLDGERIGLSLFDSSSVTAFPLTDDYDFVTEQLEQYRASFDSAGEDGTRYWSGTDLGQGASLIGDGLASCVLGFDGGSESTRPKSVVLATDNYVNGQALLTLQEAGDLAAERDVRVYALNPADYSTDAVADEVAGELRDVAEATGGEYYPLEASTTVADVIERIDEREAGLFTGARRLVVTDHPQGLAVAALLVALGSFALLWRVRL